MQTKTIDFEGYTTGALNGQDGWTASHSTVAIGSTAYAGTKAINHGGTASWNGCDRAMEYNATTLLLSFRMRWSTMHADPFRSGSMYVRQTTSSGVAFQIGGYQNLVAGFQGISAVSLGSVSLNTWYLFELEVRASDGYGRARINGGAWTAWTQPAVAYTYLGALGSNCLSNPYQIDNIVWQEGVASTVNSNFLQFM